MAMNYKEAEVVSITRTDESSDDIERGYPWRPSICRLRPIIGLAALLCTILCLFWSLGILIGSNGAPTKSWYFQPTVYLAIATAISNMSLHCALVQAAPISWWNKALKGSTIQDLELEYEAGQSVPRAVIRSLKQGRFAGLLLIASIASTLVIIDGPLLQRSSSVHLATLHSNRNLNFSISPEIPRGFAGTHGPQTDTYRMPESVYDIAVSFLNGDPIRSSTSCNGVCVAKVHGPGLVNTMCNHKVWHITPSLLEQRNVSWGTPSMSEYPTPMLVFTFGAPNTIPGPELLRLTTGRLALLNGHGTYTERNCTFVSGLVEYHIEIRGDSLTFASPPSSGRVVAVANNTYFDYYQPGVSPMEITPFAYQLLPQFSMDGNVVVEDGAVVGVSVGSITPAMARYASFTQPGQQGEFRVNDPQPDIVSKFDDVLFRAGLISGTWSNLTDLIDDGLLPYQLIRANQTQQENVFHSDLRWFAGAATVQVLALLLVLPVFWGWWKIGVDLSTSPLHMAKMFGSPLLEEVSSAASLSAMIQEVGSKRIKLGVVDIQSRSNSTQSQDDNGGRHGDAGLRLDEPQYVAAPGFGDRFRH